MCFFYLFVFTIFFYEHEKRKKQTKNKQNTEQPQFISAALIACQGYPLLTAVLSAVYVFSRLVYAMG